MLPVWLAKIGASLLGGPIVNAILDGYKAKLGAQESRDHQAVDLAKADITAGIERDRNRRDLGIAAMSHPVWWVAWALFVLPPGLYHAEIYLLSMLSISPADFAVLKVPAEQSKVTWEFIKWMLGAQVGSGVVGAVIQRLGK